MITLTKSFRFEAAHAILNYPGACGHIHGHSYELHVTVRRPESKDNFINGQGLLMDFKELKEIVKKSVIEKFDHHLILSTAFVQANPNVPPISLIQFEVEPTAENLLIFIRNQIRGALPAPIELCALTLWETRDSYAQWLAP